VADSINTTVTDKVAFGAPGFVPRNNQDGGLATTAAALEKGAISSAVKSTTGDGYYFVKLVDSNDSQVNYEYIHIPLTVFARQLVAIEDEGKVTELIKIPEISTTNE